MIKPLVIVMYHYVRQIKKSNCPNIKGLEFSGFQRQLDFLQSRYTIIGADKLIQWKSGSDSLPHNPCLLTFDDGYKDHFKYVLPELLNRGLEGSFFPPVRAVVEREMLDVNMIQFVLSACQDEDDLVQEINNYCCEYEITEQQIESYWHEYAVESKYDSRAVIYIKRMLQHVLPEKIREKIVKSLFVEHVTCDFDSFADQLYMSIDDVKKLVEFGMYVGGHGYSHKWLDKETKENQETEIKNTLLFLVKLGLPIEDWIMCYPYGAYNEGTLEILKASGCSIGLTSKVGIADLASMELLELPRMDTNDFPQ